MITAQEAQKLTNSKSFTLEQIESGIKMMAKDGKNYWAATGLTTPQIEQEIRSAGFDISCGDGMISIKW
jgi:hypothetical protein